MTKPLNEGASAPMSAGGALTPELEGQLDKMLHELYANKDRWAAISPEHILGMLKRANQKLHACADEWALADVKNRGRTPESTDSALSYLAGPILAFNVFSHYIRVFEAICKNKKPKAYGKFSTTPLGQTTVSVFPFDLKSKLLFKDVSGELVFKSGLDKKNIIDNQATVYFQPPSKGKVALVLGAGNYSVISLLDVLHKLLTDREVVMLKLHPVTRYVGEFVKKILSEFIDEGFLQLCEGGADVGQYLITYPWVNNIHITGSDKSFEMIAFNTTKEVSGELGCVTPVIVIPGPWSKADIDYQAENIVSTMAFNGGFSCNASRVIIQQKEWLERKKLNAAIENVFKKIPLDACYYPGSFARMKEAVAQYPQAKCFGEFKEGKAPWVFVEGLDSDNHDELAFTSEVFGPFLTETALSASSTVEYIEKAVEFCNTRLWGTLTATIIVHPKTLRDKKVKMALEKAIKELKYGTVAVNIFSGYAYILGTLAWGGAPGATLDDIQSGNVFIQNPFMFQGIDKSVIRGPFRVFPKPAFMTNPKTRPIVHRLHEFSKSRSWLNLFKVIVAAVRG